jgi:glycosyltransferase involved in cell wall biosynthesis
VPRRLRVLWLIKGLGPGGAERLLVSAAGHVDMDRFDVEAAYLLPWKDHLVPELEAAGVRTTCLPTVRSWDPRWVRGLRRFLRDRRSDVVHAHLPYAAIGARAAVRWLRPHRPALVYTEHNTWDRYHPATRWANAATFGWNDAAIAVSEGVAASMGRPHRGWPSVHVIPNGVDVDTLRREALDRDTARKELGIPGDRPVVGTVGGLMPKKGHRVLVMAAREVAVRHPDALFVFVGLPVDPEPIRRQIAEAGLDDRVVLAGYVPRAASLMPAFDVFCLPSLFEGMPVSLLEAMSLGLASVATSAGGVPEVVADGRDALVVRPGNAGALASALDRLLADPALRDRLGAGASTTAARFGMAGMVRRVEEVYEEAVTRVRGTGRCR